MVRKYNKTNIAGFFKIVGYPDETIREVQDTIDFALSLSLQRVCVCLSSLVPISGIKNL